MSLLLLIKKKSNTSRSEGSDSEINSCPAPKESQYRGPYFLSHSVMFFSRSVAFIICNAFPNTGNFLGPPKRLSNFAFLEWYDRKYTYAIVSNSTAHRTGKSEKLIFPILRCLIEKYGQFLSSLQEMLDN